MGPLRIPAVRLALIAVLAAYWAFLGVVPAFNEIRSDFPNYYAAARIALQNPDDARLYDDAWFQAKLMQAGFAHPGKFSPHPPTTAILYMPLAFLPPLAAFNTMTALNLLFVLLAVIYLSRGLSAPWTESSLLILLSGQGLVNCFLLGQIYAAVSLSVIMGYYFYARGNKAAAGIFFGLFIPIKYFPIVFLPYFAVKKEYRLLLYSAIPGALFAAASLWLWGWETHRRFLNEAFGPHLLSNLSLQSPFAPAFQSLDGLLRRWMIMDAAANPRPWIDSQAGFWAAKLLVLFALGALAVRRFIQYMHDPAKQALCLILPALLALVIAPATATYHFLLLWLPVGLLLKHYSNQGRHDLSHLTLMAYAAIGFIPYGLFYPFAGAGGWAWLAYPRWFLILAMFLMAA